MSYWILNGDCLDKMKDIPDNSVDLILTDPPYGTTICGWDVVIPFEPMWDQIWRVLKEDGACVLFGSEPFSSLLRVSQLKYFKYDWIWEKERGTSPGMAHSQPMRRHETISVFYRKPPYYDSTGDPLKKPYRHTLPMTPHETGQLAGVKNNIDEYGNRVYAYYAHATKNSVIYFPREIGRCVHPTQKPVDLLEYLIKTYTKEGETVLDFTMGSGSTGVACRFSKRNFIGIEKSEKYYKIAEQRINNEDFQYKKVDEDNQYELLEI